MAGKIKNPNQRAAKPQLSQGEQIRIKAHLLSLCCTETWSESIMQILMQVDDRGKRLVKYEVDARGRLKTKMPKLLEAIATAMIYPPACDDLSWRDERTSHLGSEMRQCLCDQCTRINPGGSTRHVYWPASYMVKEHLSYTCAVNRIGVDLELLEGVDPDSELLGELGGGRVMMPGEAAEQRYVDPEAWRGAKTKRMILKAALQAEAELAKAVPDAEPITIEPHSVYYIGPDQTFVTPDPHQQLLASLGGAGVLDAIQRHRWRQVVGNISTDSQGREINTVRNETRGLNNLGSISDFLELGHSLEEVRGINSQQAAAITQLVDNYSREPRMRGVRVKWQRISRRKVKS